MARRLVVAGVAVSVARWLLAEPGRGQEQDEPRQLISDDLAVACGRGLDPPRGRRPFRSRLATSLVFATMFFAGAALTAGAGNELVSRDAAPLAEETTTALTDTTATDTTATIDTATTDTTTTDTTETAPAEAAAPAPADAAPAEAAPSPAAAGPASEPAQDPAAADAAAAAEATPPAGAADPSDATPAKHVAAPATTGTAPERVVAEHAAVRRATAPKRHAAPLVAAVPFRALIFNPQEWLNDNPASSTGAAVVAISEHYLGVPYRWGGAVPATGFDCSGLTQFVYEQLGVRLPHYAAWQFGMFPKLSPADLQPGDLVFFEPKADGPGHVAVYAGNDQIIEAPHTGALVRYASLSRAAAALGFLGAVRPYDASALDQQLRIGFAMHGAPLVYAA